MLEARARAKSQLGAQSTSLEFDGNNPLKFARTPEQALAQLLNPPERGFMPAERAIEDAFKDLQAHQMATLKAMQGALRATLDRFSPERDPRPRRDRRPARRILPGARDAALWAAYEREFSGVAQGSDEAFMDVFAKEFRTAYEEIRAALTRDCGHGPVRLLVGRLVPHHVRLPAPRLGLGQKLAAASRTRAAQVAVSRPKSNGPFPVRSTMPDQPLGG